MSLIETIAYRTVRTVAILGGAGVLCYNTVPHIFPNKFIQSWNDAPNKTPNNHMQYRKLLKEVCSDMKIDSKSVQFFYNNQYKSTGGGNVNLPFGSVVGLPRNLSHDDIKSIKMVCNDKSTISWDSKLGKALEESLTLSDEQIKFILAHELMAIRDLNFVMKAAHGVSIVTASYFVGNYTARLYRRINASKQTVPVSRLVYIQLLSFAGGMVLYLLTRKPLCHWLVYKNDEAAAILGPDYRQGGIDFMTKKMKFNRLLRKIQGAGYETLYSEKGDKYKRNEPFLSDRKRRLKEARHSEHKVSSVDNSKNEK